MATLEQFKEVRASVSPEVQNELYALTIQDPEAAVQRMIGIASENGASFTAHEVASYLREMEEKDEFNDIELDEATLAAVSGGRMEMGSCIAWIDAMLKVILENNKH